MDNKVSLTQKISVILAGICYVLTIYSFMTQDTIVVLVCFILHSIFLLYSSYLSFMSRADTSEFQRMSTLIETTSKERDDIQKGLLEKLSQKEDELSRVRAELEELKKSYNELTDKNNRLGRDLDEMTLAHNDELTRGILPELSKGESVSDIDVIEVAREVMADMQQYTTQADLNVVISSVDESITLKAERSRIRILLRNIIDNAVKYARRAGTLIITVSTIGDEVFLVLKDNGEGVAEAEVDHVFELNFQGSNRVSGSGLGLAQVKAIAEYYGGSVYAKSAPGNGMGIYVQMPKEGKKSS